MQSADGSQHSGRAVIVVSVIGTACLDVCVDRARDRLIRATCFVQMDHRRSLAVVTHARHQILDPGAARRGEGVAGVPKIMNVQTEQGLANGAG